MTGVHATTFQPGKILRANDRDDLAMEVQRKYAEQATPLVAQGVDVPIPGGGIPMMLLSASAATWLTAPQ